jgi:hypothetical protein
MDYGEVSYAGSICRPPMEQGACILPVEDGCSHNKCTCCQFFKDVPFRLISLEEVESSCGVYNRWADVRADFFRRRRRLRLPRTGCRHPELIRRYFPNCREVTADATVTDIRRKTTATSPTQMRRTWLPVRRPRLRPRRGAPRLNKDHDTAEAVRQLDRLNALGKPHVAHLMTGAACAAARTKWACHVCA